MRRRQFIALLGGAAAWPVAARAQKAPVRIGYLSSGAADSTAVAIGLAAIRQGLRDNGLIEGRDYILEPRFAAGRYERFPELARELAQVGASIILINTIAGARAAQQLKPPLPVVMLTINDPVGSGPVANLGHPGGLMTGMATLNEDLTSKMLEYQHAVLPNAKVIAVLFNPTNPSNPKLLDDLRMHAGAMGMTAVPVVSKSPDALDAAFQEIAAQHPDALQIISDSGIMDASDRIAAMALAQKLPSFSTNPLYVQFGGLLAYGPSREKLYVRAGSYVKKILDGADPAELPVEQPTQIELWINLKTAKALGVDVPLNIQQLADKVIE
jgi:putative tryptophan/tyrosine transport system substrate-binding protein